MIFNQIAKTTFSTTLRIALFVAAVYLGTYFAGNITDFMTEFLGYQEPLCVGFCFNLPDFMQWFLGSTFFVSLFFGTLGKKFDYIVIGTYVFSTFVVLFGYEMNVFITFFLAVILGNLFGYILKIGINKLKSIRKNH